MPQHPQRSLLPIGRATRHAISLDPLNSHRHRPHPSLRHRHRQKNQQRRVNSSALPFTLRDDGKMHNRSLLSTNSSTSTIPQPLHTQLPSPAAPTCAFSSQQLDSKPNSSVPPYHRSHRRSPLRLVAPSCSSTNLEASRNG